MRKTVVSLATSFDQANSISLPRTTRLNPKQSTIDHILYVMNRAARPMFTGAIALEVSRSISQVQSVLDKLELDGFVKKLTSRETIALGHKHEVEIWSLVEKPSVKLAHL